MSRLTLLVNYDLTDLEDGLTPFALDLAGKLDAEAIGVAACPPLTLTYADGYISGDVLEQDRKQVEGDIARLEQAFKAAFGGRAIGWRSSTIARPATDFVANAGRAADILVSSTSRHGHAFDSERSIDLGDLVMRAGRPVMIVPPDTPAIDLGTAVIGWKDARETRRAIADAVPVLNKAGRVVVVEIAAADQLDAARARLDDVRRWLAAHDIAAEAEAVQATGNDADQLDRFATERGAGLLVGGAYAHNRLTEWVLGGVTNDLLLRPTRPALVSH